MDVGVEIHAHIEVTALLNQAIAENLCFLPVQAALVSHLHRHLGQDGGRIQVSLTTARLEGNVHAVLDLVANGRIHGALDLVELQRRALLRLHKGAILRTPLPTTS